MFYGAVVLALGLIATPIAIAAMGRVGVMDVPNKRSSHQSPTVRGAGVGVAIVAVGMLLVPGMGESSELLGVALGSGAYTTLGILDDLWDISAIRRLSLQLVIAIVVVPAVGAVQPWYLAVVAVVAIVGYANAFNFMDGINGISSLHALGVAGTWAIAGTVADVGDAVLLGSVIGAAALAFLPYNFPSARGFLGDGGSYFFGSCIAISAVVLYGRLPLLVILSPLSPYVADTAWTLVRRVHRGAPWHEAHREHVYQRLLDVGWVHTQSALLVGALTAAAGASGLLVGFAVEGVMTTAAVLCALVALLAAYLRLPNLLGEEEQEPGFESGW